MPQSEYEWDTIDAPPEIGRHSLNKHEVLRSYLQRYLNKLYGKAREYARFSIVDGFAGGGIYTRPDSGELHFGSPIIIMETVAQAQAKLPDEHGKYLKLKARYYFVEKRKSSISLLENVLENLGLNPVVDEKGGCFHNDFTSICPHIIDEIRSEGKSHKALFILDQYGYSAVPLLTIQNIFRMLPQAEVILTFAADWLIDYLTEKPEHIARCQKRLDDLCLGLTVQELIAIKHSSPYSRLLIQDLLSEELSRNCGAKFFTRYFIQAEEKKGRQSHRSIWIVHMSQHEVARDEMVKVHWESANHLSCHSGFQGVDEAGLRGLGYSTHLDEALGQLNLDYRFDDSAEKASISVLLRQIPSLIWSSEVITFAELMGKLANHTPVSSDIIRKVIDVLITSQDIEVTSITGISRRKGNSVKWTDQIRPRRLSMFDYQ